MASDLASSESSGTGLFGSDGHAALLSTLDRLGIAIVLLDLRGREMHRTRSLARLLEEDSEATGAMSIAARMALELGQAGIAADNDGRSYSEVSDARPRAATGETGNSNAPQDFTTTLWTASNRYRIRASLTSPDLAAAGMLTIAVVERLTPTWPPVSELQSIFGLTKAQARVALLQSEGEDYHGVARALGISVHTARRHGEEVRRKLGVHDQAGVMLEVLGGRVARLAGAACAAREVDQS